MISRSKKQAGKPGDNYIGKKAFFTRHDMTSKPLILPKFSVGDKTKMVISDFRDTLNNSPSTVRHSRVLQAGIQRLLFSTRRRDV
jgi:hypothetical protein